MKSFDAAYRIKGSPAVKENDDGRYGDIDLDEARARAGDGTSAARKGKDLTADEEAADVTPSFGRGLRHTH